MTASKLRYLSEYVILSAILILAGLWLKFHPQAWIETFGAGGNDWVNEWQAPVIAWSFVGVGVIYSVVALQRLHLTFSSHVKRLGPTMGMGLLRRALQAPMLVLSATLICYILVDGSASSLESVSSFVFYIECGFTAIAALCVLELVYAGMLYVEFSSFWHGQASLAQNSTKK